MTMMERLLAKKKKAEMNLGARKVRGGHGGRRHRRAGGGHAPRRGLGLALRGGLLLGPLLLARLDAV